MSIYYLWVCWTNGASPCQNVSAVSHLMSRDKFGGHFALDRWQQKLVSVTALYWLASEGGSFRSAGVQCIEINYLHAYDSCSNTLLLDLIKTYIATKYITYSTLLCGCESACILKYTYSNYVLTVGNHGCKSQCMI